MTARSLLFLVFYRFFVTPFALVILPIICLINRSARKKIIEGLKLRTTLSEKMKSEKIRSEQIRSEKTKETGDAGAYVWFHCASGEFEYALPVIRALKQKQPHTRILVTYFSPSYRKKIASTNEVDIHLPLPLDFPGPVNEFIRAVQPKALLLARTDIWPELLYRCHKNSIPTLLFSARKKDLNFFDTWTSLLLMPMYHWINDIYTVSEADTVNMQKWIHHPSVHTKGDSRYDQVLYRMGHPSPLFDAAQLTSAFNDDHIPRLVLGSTWPADEHIILESALTAVKENKIQLIIAPHEVDSVHLSHLVKCIENVGLNMTSWSELNQELKSASSSQSSHESSSVFYNQAKPVDILIIDVVGILADIYSYADIAFIGNSFGRGVHSVMEPLACGLPVCVGPKHKNNREAIDFQQVKTVANIPFVTEILNADDFNQWLNKYVSLNSSERRAIKNDIQSSIELKKGSSDIIAQWAIDNS